jgi:hypothetical protein
MLIITIILFVIIEKQKKNKQPIGRMKSILGLYTKQQPEQNSFVRFGRLFSIEIICQIVCEKVNKRSDEEYKLTGDL